MSDIKSGVIIDLVANAGYDGDAQGDTYAGIENATGSMYDDEITGNSTNNVLNGNYGNDYIVDGAGADVVYGGEGSDQIVATTDANVDLYDGGNGSGDILDLSGFATAMTVNLTAGTSSNGTTTDKVKGFEIVWASAQADTVVGSGFGERILGAAGADSIRSMGGHDRLWGGADKDTFVFQSADVYHATLGWLGHDRIFDFDTAGADSDVIDISEMLAGITVTSDAQLNAAVTVTTSGGNTFIASQYAPSSSIESVCVLVGVTGFADAAALRTAGLLDVTV